MQETYWILFVLSLFGVTISVSLVILVIVLSTRNLLSRKYSIVYITALALAILLSVHMIIPCIKDYTFIKNNTFLEEDALVVEFTYVRGDPDGNGQIQYSQPRFYIESKNKYIVLNVADVEVGKKYRIRYYPNTKICEVLYLIE